MTEGGWDVVGIGENSIDEVCRLPAMPARNGKVAMTSRRLAPGGQVATAMCACARLGLRVRYVGVFGSDEQGARIRAAMQGHGVDIGAAPVRDAPNRFAVVLVDEGTGDRAVLAHRDPGLALDPADLRTGMISGARLVHVDATDPAFSLAAARAARQQGSLVTCDIDEGTDAARDLIDTVDVAILAESVPCALTGTPHVERAVRELGGRHAASLCVTLGAAGAVLLERGTLYRAPGFRVAAVDTTGAGDVFRAGFIYARLRGAGPEEILRFANAAAAISCTREGAIESVPSLEDVQAMLDGG